MRKFYLVSFICSLFVLPLKGQQGLPANELQEYQQDIRSMVQFLNFTLNIIGDPQTPARDKEIIINESYLKIFRDANVQIEDDLVPDRAATVNKDVQAYLRDIDFFYRSVTFDFTVEEVRPVLDEKGEGYFLVHMERRLRGEGIKGDSVYQSQPRFLEVNLDPIQKSLKIVSMYTQRSSEEDDLLEWWNGLDTNWRKILGENLRVGEDLTMAELVTLDQSLSIGDTLIQGIQGEFGRDTLAALNSLAVLSDSAYLDSAADLPPLPEISFDTLVLEKAELFPQLRSLLRQRKMELRGLDITDVAPLAKFRQLEVVDLSHTSVADISGLRNLVNLRTLDISHTQVTDLSALRFNEALEEIRASHTPISDLAGLASLQKLRRLDLNHASVALWKGLEACTELVELNLNHTRLIDPKVLAPLSKLEVLELKGTSVYSLKAIQSLAHLEQLNIEGTPVADLYPLSGLSSLRVLNCDSTRVLSLSPLAGLKKLRTIYCDQTMVGEFEARQLLQQRPDIRVIFNSETLLTWWKGLPPVWRQIFWPEHAGRNPEREQLHAFVERDSLILDNKQEIKSLNALSPLTRLRYLSLPFTSVDTLGVLVDLEQLVYLDCSHTPVRSLAPLGALRRIRTLDISYTSISTLEPLKFLESLEYLDASGTLVNKLISLYPLQYLKKLRVEDTPVGDVAVKGFLEQKPECLVLYKSPALQVWWGNLSESWKKLFIQAVGAATTPSPEDWHRMVYLKRLAIDRKPEIISLQPLKPLLRLETLTLNQTGVQSLAGLETLQTLRSLSFSRHAISDLTPIGRLEFLEELDCENTPVEDLTPLTSSYTLKEINCAGTQVKDLRPLEGLLNLTELDVSNTEVRNLNDLQGLVRLKQVKCFNTRISEGKIRKFQERRPEVEIIFY